VPTSKGSPGETPTVRATAGPQGRGIDTLPSAPRLRLLTTHARQWDFPRQSPPGACPFAIQRIQTDTRRVSSWTCLAIPGFQESVLTSYRTLFSQGGPAKNVLTSASNCCLCQIQGSPIRHRHCPFWNSVALTGHSGVCRTSPPMTGERLRMSVGQRRGRSSVGGTSQFQIEWGEEEDTSGK
jgi:hypothetical protein